ncbi:MAG: cytosine-specific methyltransferase [Phycisphaerae bacterium]|nr:MAG: cytosine-specific methyltransferase [Phycisphaerae bacterium]
MPQPEFVELLDRSIALHAVSGVARALNRNRSTIVRWRGGQSLPKDVDLLESKLHTLLLGEHAHRSNPADFTFIDLFAGIGGLRRGFEHIGGQCVMTSEWDKFAQQTYRRNFSDTHEIRGDITKIESDTIPAHDVLLAGFPCQPFSLAGVSKKKSLGRAHGFEDKTQGTLFFDVARIIKDRQPKAFLLENVKNLNSHDGGRTIETIMDVLRDDLGYSVAEPRVIDARCFVPQHRERTFIAGFRKDVGFDWQALRLPDRGPTLESVLHPEDGTEPALEIDEGRFLSEQGKVNSKYTLSEHLWRYLQDYRAKHQAKGNGFGFSKVGPDSVARTLSARYHKDGSEILVSRGGHETPRRLTPRECARLMGYDPLLSADIDWSNVNPMVIPVSDTQAYRQFGNSVVVPIIREIAKIMRPGIIELTHRSQSQNYALAFQGSD